MSRVKRIVKIDPYEEEIAICDWCGRDGGEFYTPYDLGGAEYPYDKYLDIHDGCKIHFVSKYGPRIWAVMDEVINEMKQKQAETSR